MSLHHILSEEIQTFGHTVGLETDQYKASEDHWIMLYVCSHMGDLNIALRRAIISGTFLNIHYKANFEICGGNSENERGRILGNLQQVPRPMPPSVAEFT